MKPNYSHTYQSCVYSLKRENAPWRVSGGCGSPARLFKGVRTKTWTKLRWRYPHV